MAKKDELNWHTASKSWRKNISIDGKVKAFYFDAGAGKSDRVAYKAAQDKLAKLRGEIKQQAEETEAAKYIRQAIARRQVLIEYETNTGNVERGERWQVENATLTGLLTDAEFLKADKYELPEALLERTGLQHSPCRQLPKNEQAECYAKIRSVYYANKINANDKAILVGENATFFNEIKLGDVPEDLSPGRYDSLSRAVNEFVAFVGLDQPLNDINENTLIAYRTHLINRAKGGDFKRKTANDKLKDARQFIRWCWGTKALDNLPRNIADPSLAISYKGVKTKAFTKPEVKRLMRGAEDRAELYMLLALNCAMLQADISNLKLEEVDWEEGRITRRRTKTGGKDGNIPEVNWKLWPRTLKLLKACRSDSTEYVLLNQNGRQLKRSEIGTDGKIDNTCNISKAYNELNKRLKITKDDKKPFKTFRATGSTTIDNNKEYSKFANHYLADAPKSIMAKHYIAHIEDRQEDFDKAIDWLGKQFDIA